MRFGRRILAYSIILTAFFAISRHYFVLALSTWQQTNWSDSSFVASSNVDTSVSNKITLSSNSDWFDTTWKYRQIVSVGTSANLTDYQIPILLNTSALISASKMNADCSDLRVTDSVGNTLPFWIATSPSANKCGQTTTKIWVKASSISTSGTNFYLYYGNSSTTIQSNGNNVFPVFADFTVGTSIPSTWTQKNIGTSGTYSVGGSLAISNTNGEDVWTSMYGATHIYYNTKIDGSFTAEALVTSQSSANEWAKSGINIQNNMVSGGGNGQAFVAVTPNNGIPFQYQSTTGELCTAGNCPTVIAPNVNLGSSLSTVSFPQFLKLTKNDSNQVSAYRSSGGSSWVQQGTTDTPWGISSSQYVSLFITPHNLSAIGTATYTFFYIRKFSASEPTVGTPNGEQATYVSSGNLTSSIIDTSTRSSFGTLSFGVTTPSNTSATVKVRTSNNADMSGANNFSSCNAISSDTDISSNNCVTDGQRYFQYQVALSTSDNLDTPVFRNISLAYENYVASIYSNTSTTSTSATISVGTTISSGEHSVVLNWNNSLAGWWKFNTDEYAGATWTSSGKYGGAYSFDGSSNFIDLGVLASAQISNNLTMSAWVKTTNTANSYRDIIANQWQYGESGIMMTLYGSSTIHVPFSTAVGTIDTLDATATVTDGNWHLINVTFASGTVKIYVDGVEKNSKTSTTVTQIAYNNSNHLLIGKDSATGGVEHFDGSIDDVQLYNRVLSIDEIKSLYNAQTTPYSNTFTSLSAGSSYSYQAFSQETDGTITQTTLDNLTIAIPTYTLNYTAGSNGSITGTANQTVDSGTSGSAVTAVANANYHFTSWSDSSTTNPRTDTNVVTNIGVSAAFAIDTYTLNYSAGDNGSILGTSSQTVDTGTSGYAVTAIANTHYHFVNWSDSSTTNPRTDTNVVTNIGVSAAFAIDTYTINYTAGSNGSITGTANQTVNYGADATAVTATADTGYHFTNWSDGSTANPRTIYNVTANKSVTANFAANDVNDPIISSISATPSSNTVTIDWTTDEDSSSQVQYGLNIAYGFSTSELDTGTRVISHGVTLPDLKPCARYYYRVLSQDATSNQSASAQQSFNTTGCATSSISGGTETVVAVTGGNVQLINNLSTAELDIPNNFASEQATFQLNKLAISGVPTGPDGKSVANNNLYNLIAVTDNDQQLDTFDNPITFTVTYGSDTETDFEESTLDVYKYDGSTWIKKNCTLNTANNTLTCSLNGFSTYAVLGNAKNNSSSSSSSSSSSTSSSSSICNDSAPVSISDLFQINTTANSAKLFFTPLADTNKYFISFSEKPNAEEHGSEINLAREGVQNFTISLLKPNIIYYFKVRGQNGCMPGNWSNIMKVKTDSRIYYKNTKIISGNVSSVKKTTVIVLSPTPIVNKPAPTVPSTKVVEVKKKCFLWWCW